MADLQPDPIFTFRFLPVERIHHGAGCSRRLIAALDRANVQRALVITGPTIANETNLLWYVEQVLGGMHAASYGGVRAHVPSATVSEAAELARVAQADVLVSLGGGSVIDTAKAVAFALREERGGAPPHIAVPTTLSAAEFTPSAGVTDEDAGVKRALSAPELTPREVFLDPELTVPTPATLWLSSGIKALDHAVESVLSVRPHPVIDTLCVEAARRLFDVLPRCAAQPEAVAPRGEAQLAAWMSLFSAATARGGLSHALGHQLGARGVPHGITSCITLAPVLRFVRPVRAAEEAHLAAALRLSTDLADAVAGLVARLGLPGRMRETSIERGELPAIAEAALEEARARSPREIEGVGVLVELLEGMW